MPKRDLEATAARGFKDKRSYVDKHGRHVLFGEDWKLQKAHLWARCGGRCEQEVCPGGPSDAPMNRCRRPADDPHHIIPRSKGRDDRLGNLLAVCRRHHELLDWKHLKSGKVSQ